MPAVISPPPTDLWKVADLHRLTVDQYHRMAGAGILQDDERVELLEGLLYRKDAPSVPIQPGWVNADELYRLTVGQYHDMIRGGILTTDDPVELLDGLLVRHMLQDPSHVGSVEAAEDVIRPLLPPGWRYRAEKPLTLDASEPEPDGVIARGGRADSFRAHPTAVDVALVIEVSNSTLGNDRGPKLRDYARAGIPLYWIINLIGRQVEVYADPDPTAAPDPTYRRRDVYAGDAAVLLSVAGQLLTTIPAAALLPPV